MVGTYIKPLDEEGFALLGLIVERMAEGLKKVPLWQTTGGWWYAPTTLGTSVLDFLVEYGGKDVLKHVAVQGRVPLDSWGDEYVSAEEYIHARIGGRVNDS